MTTKAWSSMPARSAATARQYRNTWFVSTEGRSIICRWVQRLVTK
ncbi:hypothetical protein [Sorangium sp. So ce542]